MALTFDDDLFPTLSENFHRRGADARDSRNAGNKIRRGLGSGRNFELQTASVRPSIFHAQGSARPNRLRDFSQHDSSRETPLADGAQVQVYGNVSVFEARGQYQLSVQILQTRGAGLLQAKFEALKRKLEAEGLFDSARKRALPKFPARIGIVTSPSGAAIRDMLNVLRRRAPGIAVLISPVRVQGSGPPRKSPRPFANELSE